MRSLVRIVAVLTAGLLLALAGTPSALVPVARAERLDRWVIIGPGGGGTTVHPAISPHDPRVVLVACDMTGGYLTLDGGDSWRQFNVGTTISSFAFDPSNPDVLYAGSTALWKSADRGRTWRMVFPDPARNTRELMLGDHADYEIRTEDPIYPPGGAHMAVQAIAVARDGSVVLAMSGGGVFRGSPNEGLLAASADGVHWRVVRRLPPDRVLALTLAPGGGLVVVTERQVLEQRGAEWIERAGPAGPAMHAAGAAFTSRGELVVLAATGSLDWGGTEPHDLFRSIDGGAHWTNVRGGVLATSGRGRHPLRFRALTVSPSAPDVAYVGFEGLRVGGDDQPATGIVKTDDGGRSWRIVNREGPKASPTFDGSWVESRALQPGPDIWFDAPYDIAVSPVDPAVVYATDLFRTYRTLDGGGRWAQVHSKAVGPDGWTSRGLDVTTNYGIHVDPAHPERILMSNTDMGLFRSEDGGRSWIVSSQGMPQHWRNTTYWVAFDPADSRVAWGAFSGTHDLPRPKMWRSRNPDAYAGGVGISRDGGRTWTPAPGLPPGAVTHVLVDPASPAGRRTVYACMFGRGVFKSTDGGTTWTLKNDGLPAHQPFAWRIVQDGSRLYLIVSRRSERGRIGDDGDGALFVSEDGADHWTRIALPAGTNAPTGLLVDPADRDRLYLSAWGVDGAERDTGGGVFLSTDRGASWRTVFDAGQHVYDVTLDSRTGALYICGFDQGAWRSTDRGATWSRIRGYTFKWGHRVVPDPATPDRIYITTYGGGVWYGPAEGDPAAMGDVVSPPRP